MSQSFDIGRVIAALDACCHEMDLLPAAVDMAARLEAEVAGLFIEDENLLRLWSLPAARHVTLGPPTREIPSAEQIEAELRALASQAEAVLRAAASRQGVPWSFRVVRGRPGQELHEGTMSKDLVVVGRARGLAGAPPLDLRSPLQEAVRGLARSTLHVPRQTALAQPIVIVQAGSRLLERTLAAAIRLAGARTREIEILVVVEPQEAERVQAEITRRVEALGYAARIVSIPPDGLDRVSRALAGMEGDVLVTPADLPLFREHDDLPKLLERIGLPVMIVRA